MRILAALSLCALLISANAWAQGDLDDAAKVENYYGDWLSSIPGVASVGVGMSSDGKPQIQIHTDPSAPPSSQIPQELNGIPVVIIAEPAQGDDSTEPAPTPPIAPHDAEAP